MNKNSSILYTLSDSEFISLFRSCNSYSAILRSLGLSTSGSASRTVLFARMRELSLTREDLSKDKQLHISRNKLSDSDIFIDGGCISGHTLKSIILKREPNLTNVIFVAFLSGITTILFYIWITLMVLKRIIDYKIYDCYVPIVIHK